jgi:c-di-GMP-binding flagellar brake protein YcgR
MEAKEILTIGELMEIKVGDGFIKTKLQELLPDNQFTVFHPTVKGLLVRLEAGDTYMMRFYRENGVYSFDARLLDQYSKNEIRLCLFEAASPVVKVQRRRSYRLPIVLNARLLPEGAEQGQKPKPIRAKTVDLSEHGALLTCFTPLEPDTAAMVELKLSPTETMALSGMVLRCEKPPSRKDPYRIVMLFTGSSEQQESELRRYILRQQIAARKKKNQEVLP